MQHEIVLGEWPAEVQGDSGRTGEKIGDDLLDANTRWIIADLHRVLWSSCWL